ncbi:MAG: DNA-3-methyladenine glycosylase [Parasphingorhabdus sp.]
MGLSKEVIMQGLDIVCQSEPKMAVALETCGYPEPRIRPEGYATLLRTILGQQVSVASAASVWNKLETLLGHGCPPDKLIARDFDELRACGMSRQKQGYARSLAALILSGELDLENLPKDDEQAIAKLVQIKGIGRWSAEIYLLFALGRQDIWPAGDLAVQIGIGKIMGHDDRPSEQNLRDMALPWSPYRGAVAIFTWHMYNTTAL